MPCLLSGKFGTKTKAFQYTYVHAQTASFPLHHSQEHLKIHICLAVYVDNMNYLHQVGDDREVKTGSLSEPWSKEGNHHLNSQLNVQVRAFPLHLSNSLHFSFIIFKNFIHLFVLCTGVCANVNMCNTEDKHASISSYLSSYGSWNWTLATRLSSKSPYQLSHLASAHLPFSKEASYYWIRPTVFNKTFTMSLHSPFPEKMQLSGMGDPTWKTEHWHSKWQ